ncbi:M14 family metallopeptidase [Pontibacter mangrovi]|uniref:Peptidase M14 n=1 Tax=Pontibacter mangrovi TaxID=2589816 RepID=A0A501WBM6_9BACT|nr:M14 metallopeptidase family protein [Pontibacter mangrovi]TPE46212.1 peptidase M14 [Pontibacter mangrovi]
MAHDTDRQTQPTAAEVAQQVYRQYHQYAEEAPALQRRRFKHHEMVPLLERLQQHEAFEVEVAGQSVEQRDIYLVKAGTGDINVMLWSQMHGDESTATMALFDLFNFLHRSDELDPLRRHLLQHLTLHVVPMLNPDGAERFSRRNALEVDLNRDALRLQSPEARLLKQLRDRIAPEFGFNLHDQSRYYTAGNTPNPATIAFLAPAFDHAQTVNQVRERAMRTIAGLQEALQQFIPGQVAKFSDEHEPRAFGDNIQKWGTSVILIESGGYHNDQEKQYMRQLNFTAMVSALHLIAGEGYKAHGLENYYGIPENQRNLYDVVLRHVRHTVNGHDVALDVGILRQEVNAPFGKGYIYKGTVEEIGDMHLYHGYQEIDATGLRLVPGNVYEPPFRTLQDLDSQTAEALLAQGYTTVRVEQLPPDLTLINPLELPLNVVGTAEAVDHTFRLGEGANFSLQAPDGTVVWTIVNGFALAPASPLPDTYHALPLGLRI